MSENVVPRKKFDGWLVISAIFITIGILLLVWPKYSDYEIQRLQFQKLVEDYDSAYNEQDLKDVSEANQELLEIHQREQNPFAVIPQTGPDAISDQQGSVGILGRLLIPKIKQNLTIFNNTSEIVLEQGVGHIEGSSFPVGGIGTHSLLTGHNGLGRYEILTDLDQLLIGDIFFVHSSGGFLAYKVEFITTVTPDDYSHLLIEAERDLVTLITCTPFGVNTDRLLVRGTRLNNEEMASALSEYTTTEIINKDPSKSGNTDNAFDGKTFLELSEAVLKEQRLTLQRWLWLLIIPLLILLYDQYRRYKKRKAQKTL